MNRQSLVILAGAILLGIGFVYFNGKAAPEITEIKLPETLSSEALQGRRIFEKNCTSCHGKNASGTSNGPPLVHKIYEPGHHSDKSFHRAVRNGVRPHHWQFGRMPPVEHIHANEVDLIIRYVRELQQANGIF